MSNAEENYIARFRKMRDTFKESSPGDWRKDLIKWSAVTSQGLDALWEDAIPKALKRGDMEALHSIFFQSTRMFLIPGWHSGCDHCSRFWHLLDAAATEGARELRRVLPASLGKASNGAALPVHATNLLLCLLHGPEVPFDQENVMEKAEKFTQTKNPVWDRSLVSCLLAILRQDPAGVSESLEAVRASYGRVKCAKFMRLQCLNAYGLAVLAYDFLPEEIFREVRLPEGPNFSRAYIRWRLAQTELPQRLYFTYPEDLDLMNRALARPVAVQRIFQYHLHDENPRLSPAVRKQWYLNEDAMLEDFTAAL